MKQKYWEDMTEAEQERLRDIQNPDRKATGHFTGRCMNCGSSDLWDDETAYGCNVCRSMFMTG